MGPPGTGAVVLTPPMKTASFSVAPRFALALLLAMPLGGCASIVSGEYGHPMDASGILAQSPQTPLGLVISGAEVRELSSPYFGLVAVTLENKSSNWVRVRRMTVTFGGKQKDDSVFIPWGEEIASWERATYERNAVRSYNTEAALGAVALAGGVIAGTAKDKPIAAAGGVLQAGALAASAGHDVAQGLEAVEGPHLFPETHLLDVPFSIPPGLFSKRWILLSTGGTPGVCVDSMLLDYQTDSGQEERVWLRFRTNMSSSEWQKRACSAAWRWRS
jgi:hypothetical protein